MKLLIAAVSAAVFASTYALAAPVCDMGGAEALDVFEPTKAAFLAGDFETFARLSTPLLNDGVAVFGDAINKLEDAFPDGFVSCQTVVQRVDVGGMVQEVSTFNIKGVKGPMSLYLLALPTRGRLEISEVTFNTTMSVVLNTLR